MINLLLKHKNERIAQIKYFVCQMMANKLYVKIINANEICLFYNKNYNDA